MLPFSFFFFRGWLTNQSINQSINQSLSAPPSGEFEKAERISVKLAAREEDLRTLQVRYYSSLDRIARLTPNACPRHDAPTHDQGLLFGVNK